MTPPDRLPVSGNGPGGYTAQPALRAGAGLVVQLRQPMPLQVAVDTVGGFDDTHVLHVHAAALPGRAADPGARCRPRDEEDAR